MAILKFTPALYRFFPELDTPINLEGQSVMEIMINLEKLFPGLCSYILDDQHRLRQHVNIFHNGTLIKDVIRLSDKVEHYDELFFIQALSGG